MKTKIIAISLLITSAFSILTGCSEGNSAVSEPTTTIASTQPPTTEAVPIERDDIDFTASYDKENKKINTTLTNNTGDDVIMYNNLYGLYKKVGNEWEATGFEYATYATAHYLFPYDDIKSVDLNHSAYNTAGENINYTEEKEKGGLDAGEYKVTMTFDVYPESEAKILPTDADMTYPSYNPNGMYFDSKEAKYEEVMVSAEFTVE